ncbi:MOSC domain-containing protein 2, mitochondrial [Mizuhopecten yessoensis]|uniref:MOSC domain-containing protein 2, mitochondrial n=1 Tax=Mizuhopecten yessoensis TaxID=6573 RepID=A0A210PM80_MIZYE|nr:MOSC domain-containing protein 2, mitochondrial [Mizuhopecten yessoensis]
MPTLRLPKCPKIDRRRFFECRVWDLTVPGMDCGEEASRWASDFLGKENLHMVFSAPNMKKKVITEEGVPPLWTDLVQQGDESIFSDFASYLVTTDQSLEAVNKRLDKPVSMRNFRPNIVIDTTMEAFDEDFWGELKFGENGYMRCLQPCPRCLVTTVDRDTGKRDPSFEPHKTMKKFRCKPGRGVDPFFGINASVDFPADVRVGDPVYARYRTN